MKEGAVFSFYNFCMFSPSVNRRERRQNHYPWKMTRPYQKKKKNHFPSLREEKGRHIGVGPWVNFRGEEEFHSLAAAAVGLTLRT